MKRSLLVLVAAVLLLAACSRTVPTSVRRPIPTYWPASTQMRHLCQELELQAAGYVLAANGYGLEPGEIWLLPALKAPGSILPTPAEMRAKAEVAYQSLCGPTQG